MRFSTLSQLLVLTGAAIAAPRPRDTPLNFDDIILFGDDGTTKLVKESEYQEIVARGLLVPAPPVALEARDQPVPAPPTALEARHSNTPQARCTQSDEVQVLSDTMFLGWDIAMSPVVSSAGGPVTVGVISGKSLANTLTTTLTASGNVKDVLGLSLSVSYSRTWTTTETSTILYTVDPNNYGLIVSQPMTRRVSGYYLTGCAEAPEKVDYISDSFTDQSYGSLEWVTGVMRLCNSTTYPVPYCIGTGEHK